MNIYTATGRHSICFVFFAALKDNVMDVLQKQLRGEKVFSAPDKTHTHAHIIILVWY